MGVDVLCVISGFRITSLILRDLESSKSRLIDFWEQRVRRIAPALNVWFAATLIAGWFLSLPGDYHRLGQATVAQGSSTDSASVFSRDRHECLSRLESSRHSCLLFSLRTISESALIRSDGMLITSDSRSKIIKK